MDETEIEVFRAGTRASRGITADDIATVAAFDCDANPIGCVVGHPQSDTLADGVIKGFRADGNSLYARVANLSEKIVEGIRGKKLLNRSMAFFSPTHPANPTPGKLAPRHLGFLGAAAPGIPGMPKLEAAFSFNADGALETEADPAEAVIFEAAATPVRHIQEEKPQMDPTEIEAERARMAQERECLISNAKRAPIGGGGPVWRRSSRRGATRFGRAHIAGCSAPGIRKGAPNNGLFFERHRR